MRRLLLIVGVLFVATAGAATAVALTQTITLKPGHCKTVSKSLRICAAKRHVKTITVTKTVTTAPPAQTTFPDGTWAVGTDIEPGTYQTAQPVGLNGLCYWARLSGLTGDPSEVIASGALRAGQTTVTIQPTDVAFQSEGCGTWVKIG